MNETEISLICKCLGDPTRLRIVQLLSEGELCACMILEKFHFTQPTLSYHMKYLTKSRLVKTRKDGKWNHYSIDCEVLQAFKGFIGGLTCSDGERNCSCD